MNCTCSKKIYPCPIHAPGHLPIPEVVEHSTIVIRVNQRWATNEKWFSTVTKDALKTFESTDQNTKLEALAAAVEYLKQP